MSKCNVGHLDAKLGGIVSAFKSILPQPHLILRLWLGIGVLVLLLVETVVSPPILALALTLKNNLTLSEILHFSQALLQIVSTYLHLNIMVIKLKYYGKGRNILKSLGNKKNEFRSTLIIIIIKTDQLPLA